MQERRRTGSKIVQSTATGVCSRRHDEPTAPEIQENPLYVRTWHDNLLLFTSRMWLEANWTCINNYLIVLVFWLGFYVAASVT